MTTLVVGETGRDDSGMVVRRGRDYGCVQGPEVAGSMGRGTRELLLGGWGLVGCGGSGVGKSGGGGDGGRRGGGFAGRRGLRSGLGGGLEGDWGSDLGDFADVSGAFALLVDERLDDAGGEFGGV